MIACRSHDNNQAFDCSVVQSGIDMTCSKSDSLNCVISARSNNNKQYKLPHVWIVISPCFGPKQHIDNEMTKSEYFSETSAVYNANISWLKTKSLLVLDLFALQKMLGRHPLWQVLLLEKSI